MLARRWYLLAVLTCSYGLGAFGMLGVSPLSPALMHGFALSRLEVAFIVPSVYVGGLLFSLPGGRLADRWGVRPTLLGALAMGGIGLAAAALAPRFVVFLLCLVFAGSGWSVVNPVLGKAIVDLFSLTERGIAMGINAARLLRRNRGLRLGRHLLHHQRRGGRRRPLGPAERRRVRRDRRGAARRRADLRSRAAGVRRVRRRVDGVRRPLRRGRVGRGRRRRGDSSRVRAHEVC
jgi:Major Facilitator Superfamily